MGAAGPTGRGGPRRKRRWPWIVGLALAGLAVAGALLLPGLLDVERHRERIEAALEEATGWEAELGRLELSFSRGLALGVRPASLAAPGGTSRFDVDEIVVRAAWWPLLRRELRIESLVLRSPRITLVRRDADEGWILPRLVPTGSSASPAPATTAPTSAVYLERVLVRDGALRFEDRAAEEPRVLALDRVEIEVLPSTGRLDGSAALAEGGRIGWVTRPEGGLDVTLEDLSTQALAPWIGAGVVHPGGRIGGRIVVVLRPLAVVADLTAESLSALAGTRPLPTCELHVRLVPGSGGLMAEELRLATGGAELSGAGSLVPLDLRLELVQTPLERVLELSEALFPLGLDLSPPGSAAVAARIVAGPEGDARYEARGELSAARFAPADVLPPVTDVRASFELSRAGELELSIVQGTVGGGPLEGRVHLDRIEPPGTLSFEGRVQGAALGSLLHGFVGQSADRVTGATTVEGRVAVDLGARVVDASAVRGRLELSAQEVSLADWDLESKLRESVRERLGRLAGAGQSLEAEETPAHDGVRRVAEALSGRVSFDTLPWQLPALRLVSGHVEAQGQGSLDPVGGSVDLTLTATLDEPTSASYLARHALLRVLADASGRLSLPLSVRGPLAAPGVEVDLSSVARSLRKESSKEAAKGLLDELLERQLEKKKAKKTPTDPADPPGSRVLVP